MKPGIESRLHRLSPLGQMLFDNGVDILGLDSAVPNISGHHAHCWPCAALALTLTTADHNPVRLMLLKGRQHLLRAVAGTGAVVTNRDQISRASIRHGNLGPLDDSTLYKLTGLI